MDFNLKKYKTFKIKKKLKNGKLIMFFHSSKIKSNKWLSIEKKLKKLKLKYNQISNKTSHKTLNNSIYLNINQLVCSILISVQPKYKSTLLNNKKIKKNLEPFFILLFLKLNNKIYTESQFKTLDSFSYKNSILNLSRSLEKSLKNTYLLTQNKNRNNVI